MIDNPPPRFRCLRCRDLQLAEVYSFQSMVRALEYGEFVKHLLKKGIDPGDRDYLGMLDEPRARLNLGECTTVVCTCDAAIHRQTLAKDGKKLSAILFDERSMFPTLFRAASHERLAEFYHWCQEGGVGLLTGAKDWTGEEF